MSVSQFVTIKNEQYNTDLTELDLSGMELTSPDITSLSKFTNLEVLNLAYNQISHLFILSRLTNLKVLCLDGNKINNTLPLAKLTNLTELYLSDNPVSEEQINSLKTALPNCDIVVDFPSVNVNENVIETTPYLPEIEYQQPFIEEEPQEIESLPETDTFNEDLDLTDDEINEAVEAIEVIIEVGRASTSYLQLKLKMGYSKASNLIDAMKQQNVIKESGEVLMTKCDFGNNKEIIAIKVAHYAEKAARKRQVEQDERNKKFLEEQSTTETRRRSIVLPVARPSDFTYGQYPGDGWCGICHKNAPTTLLYDMQICMECYNHLREAGGLRGAKEPLNSSQASMLVNDEKRYKEFKDDLKDVGKIATGVALGNKISDLFGGKRK
jgi:hypothetical protein